jgi:hypothetical protein
MYSTIISLPHQRAIHRLTYKLKNNHLSFNWSTTDSAIKTQLIIVLYNTW